MLGLKSDSGIRLPPPKHADVILESSLVFKISVFLYFTPEQSMILDDNIIAIEFIVIDNICHC